LGAPYRKLSGRERVAREPCRGSRWRSRRASGLLAVAVVCSWLIQSCSAPADGARDRPNLILVTVDTLRADHLGAYGYARDTSPNLDALAREGALFERCYSESATTGAAHASLFTSLPPPEHGVYANRQRFPNLPSLMSALGGAGYYTVGFASSIVVGRKSGLQDHFDHFDDELTSVERNRSARAERPANDTIAAVRRLLDRLPAGRPFFLWIHLIDPHGPYAAPVDPDRYVADALARAETAELPAATRDWEPGRIPRYQLLGDRRDTAYYVARYDAEIRYADAALGVLFADLRTRGLDERTLIAVTADHGETLDEPGHRFYFTHGAITYEETVRVPLIIRPPAGEQRLARVDRTRPVSSLDVAPTLLALLGVDAPPGFRGRNLLNAPLSPDAAMVSMGQYGSVGLEREIGTQFGVRKGPWRFIVNSKDGSEELYDHTTDPREARNVAATAEPAVLAELRDRLGPVVASRPAAEPAPAVPPEQVESLRALGYVE
jgi:arylsulfatase A-like enzyme